MTLMLYLSISENALSFLFCIETQWQEGIRRPYGHRHSDQNLSRRWRVGPSLLEGSSTHCESQQEVIPRQRSHTTINTPLRSPGLLLLAFRPQASGLRGDASLGPKGGGEPSRKVRESKSCERGITARVDKGHHRRPALMALISLAINWMPFRRIRDKSRC